MVSLNNKTLSGVELPAEMGAVDQSFDRARWRAASNPGMGELASGRQDQIKNQLDVYAADWTALAIARKIVESKSQTEKRFKRLVSEWKNERNEYSSNPMELAMCPAYQKIIAMGPEVIPLVLGELKRKPDHWFWALHVLTDENPVSPAHAGNFREMINDWLSWGMQNGFIQHC